MEDEEFDEEYVGVIEGRNSERGRGKEEQGGESVNSKLQSSSEDVLKQLKATNFLYPPGGSAKLNRCSCNYGQAYLYESCGGALFAFCPHQHGHDQSKLYYHKSNHL